MSRFDGGLMTFWQRTQVVDARRITLTLMLPYTLINPDAAFSAAFVSVGMHWAAYIVAVGALLGITTGEGPR